MLNTLKPGPYYLNNFKNKNLIQPKNRMCSLAKAQAKILFLELSLVKLLKRTLEINNDVSEFLSSTVFTIDRMILYPFLLSTANGLESRKLIFENVFTDFKAESIGVIEKDIREYLMENDEFSFFTKFQFNDEIYFIPDWEKIKDNNFVSYKREALNALSVFDDVIFVGTPFEKMSDLIDQEISNILKKHHDFILYDVNKLSKISHIHKSFNHLMMSGYETDFDGNKNDIMKEIFINEYSPLKPNIT